ncbi:MAG: CoA transferase [Alphaproteobacteria bacterium]|nr:CoA transferase [Alphaproteobacteria bacterium]
MPGPLAGIRVVDLTSMVSGPVATVLLADQGAEVVKIEPLAGEQMRHRHKSDIGVPPAFFSCNRGKKSLPLDLKQTAGADVLRKLIKTADVFVQNFRPGTIERIGFGEDMVRTLQPNIVYVSISGFGEIGPHVKQRVYDPVVQAMSGLAEIQTDRATGRPHMVRTIITDKITSVTAAQAISSALFARERTGEGQHVRLSMLDTMVAFLWPEAMAGLTYLHEETDPAHTQQAQDLIFKTQDGYITTGAVSDSEWSGMCRALDRTDLIDDPRFLTSADRTENIAERRAIMAEEIAKWTRAEILERLLAADVPSAPVLSRREIIDNDQIVASGLIEEHDFPGIGRVRQPRPAARFDKTPAGIQGPAPRLGEHSREVLAELNYGDGEIEAMIDAGAVGIVGET